MMLHEVIAGYKEGKFKDGELFLYQNNPNMSVTFKSGSLIWSDDYVAVSCKNILQDAWTYQEKITNQK
ncbi:hypothetical protein P4414_04150 [Bacillus thuringiensis]|nr:hypothetical protein [Bacillus thuringiensis]